jgi:poly(hydroxyalkanoate) granule-associated protein
MATRKNKTTKAIPTIKESAQQIWLAGLGAFALAGEEGNKLFKTLVKKGEGMEKMNKARLQEMLHRAEQMQGEAKHAIGRLTTPIENSMNSAITRLGVPSRKEIATLTRRVEELTRVVERTKPNRRSARVRRSAATVA